MITRWVRCCAEVNLEWHMMPLRCDLRTRSRILLAPLGPCMVLLQQWWNRPLSMLHVKWVPRPLWSRSRHLDLPAWLWLRTFGGHVWCLNVPLPLIRLALSWWDPPSTGLAQWVTAAALPSSGLRCDDVRVDGSCRVVLGLCW